MGRGHDRLTGREEVQAAIMASADQPTATAPQAPAVRQPDHVGILVHDLDAALRFYRDTLGLPLAERVTRPGGTEIVFLRMGSAGYVELIARPGLEPAEPRPPRQAGLQHFALQVADLDAWIQHLASRDVPLTVQPFSFEAPSARCRGLFIADPDVTPVELFERTPREDQT